MKLLNNLKILLFCSYIFCGQKDDMADIEEVMAECNPWHRVVVKEGDKRHIKLLGKRQKELRKERTITLTPGEYLEFRAIVEMCLEMHHKMYSGASEFMRLKKKIKELEEEVKELKNDRKT